MKPINETNECPTIEVDASFFIVDSVEYDTNDVHWTKIWILNDPDDVEFYDSMIAIAIAREFSDGHSFIGTNVFWNAKKNR